MWINGEWVESSSGEIIEVENPSTEEIIDTVPAGTKEDAARAVEAAYAARGSGGGSPASRGQGCSMRSPRGSESEQRT
jgi:acyl-CoA reductase-like NAD-dependent aldehyde dehydrogenase